MFLIRHTLRSFRHRKAWFVTTVLSAVLGVTGILCLLCVQNSIRKTLSDRSRVLMTADLTVGVRRRFNDSERNTIRKFAQDNATAVTSSLELYSMIRSEKEPTFTRLVDLVGVESNYPLYGEIKLFSGVTVTEKKMGTYLHPKELVLDQDLMTQLSLAPKDTVLAGDLNWKVGDSITEDTSSTWRGFALAPRAFLLRQELESSSLLQQGSTLSERFYFQIPPGANLKNLKRSLGKNLTDAGIRIQTHEEGSEQVGKSLDYLGDYLGLISLVSFLLATLGIFYLVQSEKKRLQFEGTLYRVLGAQKSEVKLQRFFECLILSLSSSILSIGATLFILPKVTTYLSLLSGAPFLPRISGASCLLTFALSFLAFFLSTAIVSMETDRSSLSELFLDFQNHALTKREKTPLFLGALVCFGCLTLFFAHSYSTSLLFVGALIGSVVLLWLSFRILLWILKVSEFTKSQSMIYIERHIRRKPWEAFVVFLSFGIGSLLLTFIPQLRATFLDELTGDASKPPSLFLFDIQEEQVLKITSFFSEKGFPLQSLSPMIRARLEKINGQKNSRDDERGGYATREEEEEARTRNRGYNLSTREKVLPSEKIISGRDFSGTYSEKSDLLPEITLEKDFAKRLGMKLGDTVRFDIQSVPIDGKVVGIRRVKWSSFQPNFFIQFQPGSLVDAPKTFLATVPDTPSEKSLNLLQSEMLRKFPNVSVISVGTVIEKLKSVFAQMGAAVTVTAWISLLTGSFVFLSVFRSQSRSRQGELQLLKVVGASEGLLRKIFLGEFLLLGSASLALGSLFSFFLNQAFAQLVFNRWGEFPAKTLFWLIAGILVSLLCALLIGTERVIRTKSNNLFDTID